MTERMAEALERLRVFLEKHNADPEITEAFDTVRNCYTELVGKILLLCVKTGPEIEED